MGHHAPPITLFVSFSFLLPVSLTNTMALGQQHKIFRPGANIIISQNLTHRTDHDIDHKDHIDHIYHIDPIYVRYVVRDMCSTDPTQETCARSFRSARVAGVGCVSEVQCRGLCDTCAW